MVTTNSASVTKSRSIESDNDKNNGFEVLINAFWNLSDFWWMVIQTLSYVTFNMFCHGENMYPPFIL